MTGADLPCYIHMDRILDLSCFAGLCTVSQQLIASSAPEVHLQSYLTAPMMGLLNPSGWMTVVIKCGLVEY